MWSEDQALIIQESYREGWSLPGGAIRPGEKASAAAVREAKEEVGVRLASDALGNLGELKWMAQNIAYRIHLFEAKIVPRPTVHIDNREIVRAEWRSREAALAMDLAPPLRQYLSNLR
jgi:8-oxo-dGTP pyrophosphatase MutT (NUDIX family)